MVQLAQKLAVYFATVATNFLHPIFGTSRGNTVCTSVTSTTAHIQKNTKHRLERPASGHFLIESFQDKRVTHY